MVAFVSLQCLLGILCGINLAVVFAPWRETLVALIIMTQRYFLYPKLSNGYKY